MGVEGGGLAESAWRSSSAMTSVASRSNASASLPIRPPRGSTAPTRQRLTDCWLTPTILESAATVSPGLVHLGVEPVAKHR